MSFSEYVMTFSPTSYSVTIAGVVAASPSDGFIDNTKLEQYMAAGAPATTYVQAQAKERGNYRFRFLQQAVQFEANVYMENMDAPGGTGATAPTSFSFTAVVERGDDVLVTRDETNAGATLTGVACLKRWVARALVRQQTQMGVIYDPTEGTTKGNTTPAARYGARIEPIVVGALAADLPTAEALITITKLT
jgi:hypothetical protein